MVVFIVIFVFVNAYPFYSVFLENPGFGVGLVAIRLFPLLSRRKRPMYGFPCLQ